MNRWNRRQVIGAAAALFAPLPARAGALAARDSERLELMEHVRGVVFGFDVLALAQRILGEARAPPRLIDELTELLAGRDTSRGFETIQEWMDDRELMGALGTFTSRWTGKLSIKLKLVQLMKRAPTTPEGRQALREHMLTEWFGLDMARLRAHVTGYDDGLSVTYGPVKDFSELSGLILNEPFALYLGLTHMRRPKVQVLEGSDPVRALLDIALDPKVRVLALTGHGTWSSFSLYGWNLEPDSIYAELCDRAASDPKGLLRAVAKGSLHHVLERYAGRGSFEESELATLIGQLSAEERAGARKELVVRHTCGSGRYRVEDGLWLLKLVPVDIKERMYLRGDRFSAAAPADVGTYEAALGQWLDGREVRVEEQDALGTCLVADPADTRGYEGLSWLPDFIAAPRPEPLPVASFAQSAPEPHSPWGPLTETAEAHR